ncbi:PAS domain S-box protein [Natronoarchaeum sp. GCM10025703]|uniref:PAS domain-containing protein n=1 Tax=unclassified Natronoarchaeum TaxID=2620183 RepID=UPI00360DC64B
MRRDSNDEVRSDPSAESVLSRIDDPILAYDERLAETFRNAPADELLSQASVTGEGGAFDSLVALLDDDVRGQCRRSLERKESVRFEAYADEVDSWFQVRIHPSADGVTLCLRESGKNRPAQTSDSCLSGAMEASIDGMAILDENREFVYLNRAHATIYGYEDPEELVGRSWTGLYNEGERERFQSEIFPTVDASGNWRGEATGVRADGTTFPQEVSLTGRPDGSLVCAVRDISERKRQERDRTRLLADYESIMENADDAIFLFDVDGDESDPTFRYRQLSASHEAKSGLETESIRGKTPRDVLDDEVAAEVEANYRRCVTARERISYEETLSLPAGTRTWQTTLVPVVVDDEVVRVVGSARDVTEHVEQEQELRELKERLDLAIRGAELGVWDWNVETDAVEFNEQWASMLGFSPAELDSHLDTWEERVHPADMERVEEQLSAHLTGETELYDCEHRMQTKAGDWKWIRDVGKVVERDDDGEPKRAVGIHLDITEHKKYEETIERTREQLRQIVDLVPDLLFAKNRDGEYILANEATAASYGLTPDEVEGKTDSEILPDADQSENFQADDLRVIESGEALEIPEEELTTADGETRVLRTTKLPYTVAGTDQDAVLGYARDITDLKTYESRIETQRDNLEILNRIVHHDIRNKLQLVSAYAQALEDDLDGKQAEYLEQILRAGDEAIDITTSAKEMTDILLQSESELVSKRLSTALHEQIEDTRSDFRAAVVRLDGSLSDVVVTADDMLDSVFRNLLQNAVLHNDSDVPEIEVSTTEFEDRVRISIADNGPGVPDDLKDEIFDEGEQGLDSEGSGLGLYLVRTLVDRYGGDIRVEDNDSGGATFVVELARAE